MPLAQEISWSNEWDIILPLKFVDSMHVFKGLFKMSSEYEVCRNFRGEIYLNGLTFFVSILIA